mgnify:CR=1 FL=1
MPPRSAPFWSKSLPSDDHRRLAFHSRHRPLSWALVFFRGSETALTASSRARMLRLEKHGKLARGARQSPARHARAVDRRDPDRQQRRQHRRLVARRPALLLNWFGDVGVLYATVIMTVVVVVFAEVLPKTVAINAPDRIALAGRASDRLDRCGCSDRCCSASRRWCVGFCRLFGFRVGDDQAIPVRRTRNCAAPSISCTTKAASRSMTATCSAVCSTCAISPSPTS